jgi:hypothetical protein
VILGGLEERILCAECRYYFFPAKRKKNAGISRSGEPEKITVVKACRSPRMNALL